MSQHHLPWKQCRCRHRADDHRNADDGNREPCQAGGCDCRDFEPYVRAFLGMSKDGRQQLMIQRPGQRYEPV